MSPFSFVLAAALANLASAQDASAATDRSSPRIVAARVGLANQYKVGYWTPVWVEVDRFGTMKEPRIELTVVDSDDVATTASAPLRPAASPDARPMALIYTMIGRLDAPLRVSLVADGHRIDEATLRPGVETEQGTLLPAVPPTGELIVALGSAPFGLAQAFPDRESASGQLARRVVRVDRVGDLPTDWFGYEAVDVLVISTGDGALCRELAAAGARFAALVRWVELGGRVVILCGGEPARELLASGGPLAALVPGRLADVVRLSETGPLEHFSQSAAQLATLGAGTALLVPRLVEVPGNIEAYAGRRPTDLPLVARAARGLGEVTFAGVDLTQPPLAAWSGRSAFLQALLRPYVTHTDLVDSPQTLVTRGYNDLSGALRQQLGRSFAAVAPIAFPVVAALAMAYLLCLGPLDYVLVHRWLRQPWAAWITFPLLVLLFGVGGLVLADWRKGAGQARVNRLQLVDVDMASGQARGTFWATLYGPEAERLDLSLNVSALGVDAAAKEAEAGAEVLLSWWGLPGVGIGGMQAGGVDLGIVQTGYHYAPQRNGLDGVPILTSSTKSLLARWTAPAGPLVEAQLADEDGMIAGSLVNQTGRVLRNVRLLYGGWGYRLGNLGVGQRVEVGKQLNPISVKTLVTRSALGAVPGQDQRDSIFVAERASAEEILNLMMFYEAGGGFGFAQLPSRYQAHCDLSRLLALRRAILVADVPGPGSHLIDRATGQPLGGVSDFSTSVYRIVLPVERSGSNDQ